MGQDLGARRRQLLVGTGDVMRERIRRVVFAVVLFLVLLFGVTIVLQAVQDPPDEDRPLVTDER